MNDVLKTSADAADRVSSVEFNLKQVEEKVTLIDSVKGQLSSMDTPVQGIKMHLAEEVKNYFRGQPAWGDVIKKEVQIRVQRTANDLVNDLAGEIVDGVSINSQKKLDQFMQDAPTDVTRFRGSLE